MPTAMTDLLSCQPSVWFSSLVTLSVAGSQMNGTIPSCLGQLSSLRQAFGKKHNVVWIWSHPHTATLPQMQTLTSWYPLPLIVLPPYFDAWRATVVCLCALAIAGAAN